MKAYLSTAIQAAIEAGEAILTIYEEDFDVELKSDNSPLTKADKKANTIINNYLKNTNLNIISEENKQIPFAKRKHWNPFWMVDPLDGTKEFIKRNGEFTVNIALIHHNKPVLGVIYVPVSKTLYYTIVADKKAYKQILSKHQFNEVTIGNERNEIHPNSAKHTTIKIVGSRSHKSEATEQFIKTIENEGASVEIVSKGSSLKFCMVAEGNAQIYPRFAPTMEWDTAAGHAICNAVGLKVKQAASNIELQYNKENLLNPYFIVA